MFSTIFRDLEKSIFNEYGRDQASFQQGYNEYPNVNIYRKDDVLHLLAELPGVHPENIEVSVKGQYLTLSGKTDQTEKSNAADEGRIIRREFDNSEFTRKLKLPVLVNSAKVEAKLENGILKVELPLAEEAKPRKIEIK